MMKYLGLIVLLLITLSTARAQQRATVGTNVRTAVEIIGPVCVDIVLERKSVVVSIPCRLPDGGFDHSFWNLIELDQMRAKLEKGYKSHWRKTPKPVAWLFGDGDKPFRERVKAGGLEADRYDWTDKKIPDYILELMKKYAQIEQAGGPTAPPYFFKMDVDYGHGLRNFFNQELPHILKRESTNQDKIAAILEKRKAATVALKQVPAAPTNTQQR
jgi:hypothetical protein